MATHQLFAATPKEFEALNCTDLARRPKLAHEAGIAPQ